MASPVVRITPNELHFSDPEFHSEIYSGHKNPKDKYAPFYHFTGATQSAFETHDHKLHNSRRQPLMSAFSKRSIVAIEPLILEKVNMLSQRFETAYLNKTVIKLDSAFSALTADITSQYAYGRCFGYLEDKDFKNDIRESLLASLTLFHIVRFFPIVMKGAKVLPFRVVQSLNPMLSKVLGLRKLINAITIEELHTMKQGKTSDAMLIQVLNNPSIPESERSLERLNDEGFVFMNAGTTTGKTLAFIMFHLLKDNGAYYSVLQQELIKTFPEGMERLTWKDLETLPYLRGVIYEGLRLSIGPLTRLPRVAPTEPLIYQGRAIPPGTGISECNYFLHMDPVLFPNPAKYLPQRWITAEENGERLQKYIVTFGKGTRHCLGMNLAYAEMFMTVAVIVRRFCLELHETTEADVEVIKDRIFGYPRNPSQGVRVLTTKLT
ncbi:hypothetical protein TrVGV298_012228 [Trichoderma virens]|nr:hypothetical protein TrVGV298_012228 [Trichoderma virens]